MYWALVETHSDNADVSLDYHNNVELIYISWADVTNSSSYAWQIKDVVTASSLPDVERERIVNLIVEIWGDQVQDEPFFSTQEEDLP